MEFLSMVRQLTVPMFILKFTQQIMVRMWTWVPRQQRNEGDGMSQAHSTKFQIQMSRQMHNLVIWTAMHMKECLLTPEPTGFDCNVQQLH